jgi:hypothetical protein
MEKPSTPEDGTHGNNNANVKGNLDRMGEAILKAQSRAREEDDVQLLSRRGPKRLFKDAIREVFSLW